MNSAIQNILVIVENHPQYLGGSGDQKIIYTTYYQLPNIYFCILNDAKNETDNYLKWTYNFGLSELYEPQKIKWRYENVVKSFSMNHERFIRSEIYHSRISRELLEIIESKNIHIMVFEQTGLLMWSWYRMFSNKLTCILRVHDSHFHYYLLLAKKSKRLAEKMIYLGNSIVQKKFEREHIKHWDQIQFLSIKEYKYYLRKYPDLAEKIIYTPSSIMQRQRNDYLINRQKNTDILFVGTMNWKPNTDAIRWFLSEVLPIIKAKMSDIKIKIIGKNASQKIEIYDENVEVIDYVQSLDEEFKSARLFINPSQSGGGIKVKVMHASSYGLPIISTSEGISGFNENIRKCLLIKDKPIDFAYSVIQLLSNDKLRVFYSRKIFKYSITEFNIHKNQCNWKESILS